MIILICIYFSPSFLLVLDLAIFYKLKPMSSWSHISIIMQSRNRPAIAATPFTVFTRWVLRHGRIGPLSPFGTTASLVPFYFDFRSRHWVEVNPIDIEIVINVENLALCLHIFGHDIAMRRYILIWKCSVVITLLKGLVALLLLRIVGVPLLVLLINCLWVLLLVEEGLEVFKWFISLWCDPIIIRAPAIWHICL